ncbi:MAG: hypothetical protein ACO3YY_02200 [Phycisphaerales bacterium]|jgi:hypothetical protein|nr:hypothetical protein [Planctomycetota bacterium]
MTPTLRGRQSALVAAAKRIVVATLVVGVLGGCVSAWPPDFESPNPPDQTAAIIAAVNRYRPFEATDADSDWTPPWTSEAFRDDVAWLVVLLQSDDPGVRFLAIEALDRLVGERHGFEASSPWSDRAVAVAEWARFLHERGYVGASPLPPAGLLPPAPEAGDA